MRPTRRAVLLVFAGAPVSLVLALAGEALWPFGLALPAVALFVLGLDALLAPTRRGLAVATRLPPLLYIGDDDPLEVALANRARGPATDGALVCEVSGPLLPPAAVPFALAPGAEAVLTVPLVPSRRGEVRFTAVWLRWCGPLGLVARHWRLAVDEMLPVVPNVRAVRTLALRYAARDALFGIKPQRQQGDGSTFESLRDYVPGLDHRSIDWKHSARHRALVCKEFETERNHQIIFAFDTGRLMSEPMHGVPKLDHAINAALLMIYMSLRAGDRVGVFGFDSAVRLYAEPVGGIGAFTRIQREIARLDYTLDETNYTLCLMRLLGSLNRRTLIVVMTDFVDTVTAELMLDNVGRLAKRHLVLFVSLRDPVLFDAVDAAPAGFRDVARAVIADSFIHDRKVVFERLRRLGVMCLEAPREQVAVDLINRYLAIKREERI
ncbi:MAG: DUF58 domain-containing protein [Alphaproteobacteria bacterium]